MDALRGAGSGCAVARREAGRGGEGIGHRAGHHRRLLISAWMARQQQRGGDVIRRFCGETAEVHAEPTMWPKSGPCGANDCMSRQRRLNGPPSLVKEHSPDHDARPDVLPIFFYFVGRVFEPLTGSTHFSRQAMCNSGSLPTGCTHRCAYPDVTFLCLLLVVLCVPTTT